LVHKTGSSLPNNCCPLFLRSFLSEEYIGDAVGGLLLVFLNDVCIEIFGRANI